MTTDPAEAPLADRIAACRLCADGFAASPTAHAPRPVVWFRPGARILIAGQAPGARVHASGRPFNDPSGDRLRAWTGLDADTFYDRDRVALVPMAFCYPGTAARGGDLPPPPACAANWRAAVLQQIGTPRLVLALGAAAIGWHIGPVPVARAVADWRDHLARGIFPLPHPSWRNTAWIAANPWFTDQTLPALR
ncbi:MAG: uracil-DNA glycosylase family protein, partial [Rhodobacterales bacterium]|nr:uracil-DNA glycosylase family protein [Rhodobacterales bacterium]